MPSARITYDSNLIHKKPAYILELVCLVLLLKAFSALSVAGLCRGGWLRLVCGTVQKRLFRDETDTPALPRNSSNSRTSNLAGQIPGVRFQ